MDIHSAKKNVEKLLSYIEDMSSKDTKLYAKSRDRLKEIAESCNQVVSIISDLLQEEMLKDDSVEFKSSKVIDDALGSMEYQLSKVHQFTTPTIGLQGIGSADPVKASENTSEQSALSAGVRKKVLSTYSQDLSILASNNAPHFAGRCANLLWTWFDTRFYKTIPGSSFKYNIRRFPEWLQGIVVMYGKAIHDNTVMSFEYEFQSWIDSIQTSEAKNKYAIPYPVYQFCTTKDPSALTLDAVVLWDILLDYGLDKLCTSDKQDLYLDQYSVYNLCDDLNPTVLENYCDYTNHPEIFTLLKWEV